MTERELRVVPDPPETGVGAETPAPGDDAGAPDPLLADVARIEELPLTERPAAFDRVNARLVAELNALEEV